MPDAGKGSEEGLGKSSHRDLPTANSLEAELAQVMIEAEVPKDKIPALVHSVEQVSAIYSGPLPPPALFAAYGDIVPDAPERILQMAEREQSHRHAVNESSVNADVWMQKGGLLIGGLLAAIAIFGAFFFFYIGNNTAGIAFLGVPVLGLVGRFLNARLNATSEVDHRPKDEFSVENEKQRVNRSDRNN